MIAGHNMGLDFQTMRTMQLGAVLDFCIEAMNQRTRAERKDRGHPEKRKATQADIDAFFGKSRRKRER